MVFAPAPPPWKPLPVSPLAARHESVACEREGGQCGGGDTGLS